jgi:hypothetical protein
MRTTIDTLLVEDRRGRCRRFCLAASFRTVGNPSFNRGVPFGSVPGGSAPGRCIYFYIFLRRDVRETGLVVVGVLLHAWMDACMDAWMHGLDGLDVAPA